MHGILGAEVLGTQSSGLALRGQTDGRKGVEARCEHAARGPQDPTAGFRAASQTEQEVEMSIRRAGLQTPGLVPPRPAQGTLHTADPSVWEEGMPRAGPGLPPPAPKLLWPQPQPVCVPYNLQTGGEAPPEICRSLRQASVGDTQEMGMNSQG